MRRIIVPVSYMESGSSAVTDLVSEFKGVSNEYRNFEYVFLHCPNGVFDLEDKLLIGNNSLRSDEALHSFLNTMKELYDKKYWWVGNYKKIINPQFYQRTIQYIEELTDIKLDTYWYYQENTDMKMFFKLAIRKIVYLFSLKKIQLKKPQLYKEMLLAYPSPSKFYKISQQYIYDILDLIDNKDNDVLLDQLILPHNLYRTKNYFKNNVKFIVVDRDPRDVFIVNKYFLTKIAKSVPYSRDVHEFCKQYKMIREMERKVDDERILRIHFEDLIYKYDETLKRIMKFLDFTKEDHIFAKRRFDPDKSIKNTKIFIDDKYKEECRVIEKELKDYLYF